MLSYAYKVPDNMRYNKVQTEDFDNVFDLLSRILVLGVSEQIKRGLIKDYVEVSENTSSIKGKINITESINSLSFLKKRLNCTFDEFSVDCDLNQIIKSTMNLLLRFVADPEIRGDLKKLLGYFSEVDFIDVNSINWRIRFDSNNQTYMMLVNICYMVIMGYIQTEKPGEVKLREFEFEDRILENLFERFILNYYKKEHPEIKAHSPKIDWQVEEGSDSFLPKMNTDVTLEHHNKILIIDAKFYSHNIAQKYGKDMHHSGNLYQIFTYVKNKGLEMRGKGVEVSGMLLYAGTSERIQPNSDYVMGGNKISVKTLDLNQDFEKIKGQLDWIVSDYLIKEMDSC